VSTSNSYPAIEVTLRFTFETAAELAQFPENSNIQELLSRALLQVLDERVRVSTDSNDEFKAIGMAVLNRDMAVLQRALKTTTFIRED